MKKQVSENPAKNRISKHVPLIIVTAMIVTMYLTSNVMAVRIISIGDISIFDAGTITFPITYMLGDVLTEIWGFKTARKVIWMTLLCNIIFVVFTGIGVFLPAPDYAQAATEAYNIIFGYTPRIVAASFVGFLLGELINAWTMEKIKKATGGRHMWMRTIGSSAVGHFIDTVLFVIIAFLGTAPISALVSMILIQYVAKLLIEVVGGTPLAYGLVAKIRQYCEE